MKNTLLIKALFLVLITQPVFGQTVWSKYAGEFMAIGVGGRALGMGGAQVAFTNDVTAGYWNPAGLARLNYPQFSLMHEENFGDLVNYNYAAVALPLGETMSLGLSIIRLGIEGIPDTRNALYDSNGDGVLDINTDRLDYDRITEFNNTDWAFFMTLSKKASEKFFWGFNLKIIRRDIAEQNALGFGFDVGAVFSPVQNLYFGANAQDVTTTLVAWSTGRMELITPTLKLGSAYHLDMLGGTLTPALDLDLRFENRQYATAFNLGPVSFDPHYGVEYNFQNLISVRGGYSDVRQFTVGAGIKLPKLNIDYSFARFAEKDNRLPNTHRISLILTLEEPKFLREGL